MGTGGSFPGREGRKVIADFHLYLHFSIHLHDVELNELSTGTSLPLLYFIYQEEQALPGKLRSQKYFCLNPLTPNRSAFYYSPSNFIFSLLLR
jgi:hypothetical protein